MGLLEVAKNIVDLLLNHVLSILLVGRCVAKPPGVNAIEGVCPHTPLTEAPQVSVVVCILPQMIQHVFMVICRDKN